MTLFRNDGAKGIGNKRSTLICFIGIDGSGKTTQAKALCESLARAGIKTRYVWTRFEPKLIKPLVAVAKGLFFRGKDVFRDYADYVKTKRNLSKNTILLTSYQYLLLFDYFFQIFLRVRLPLMQGKVIVCDRYIYDTIADLAADYDYSGEEIQKALQSYLRLFPKPDLVFLLDLPEELAYQRKGDVPSMDYLAQRRKIYLNMGKNIVTLDATKEVIELTDIVKSSVFQYLGRR